jgi:hypothetical protein
LTAFFGLALLVGVAIVAGRISVVVVACHVDGTTRARFLPRSWDHRSASCGTARRVVTPAGRGRLFDRHVLFSGREVADDGVPGGRRD